MNKKNNIFKILGPGIIVAATGIGAGDLIAAAVSGAQYGYALLWAAVLGGILKYVLNEGGGMAIPTKEKNIYIFEVDLKSEDISEGIFDSDSILRNTHY